METNSIQMTKPEMRKYILKLAFPAILEMLMQTLLGFADMAMVGVLGAAGIAAVGLSDMPIMTAIALFAAISVGTTALVSRAVGAKNISEATEVGKQSLIISVFFAIIFTILGLIFSEKLIILMGAEEDVIPLATSYFRHICWGIPMLIVTMIMSGVLRGSGDTKTPMYINGIANILNIIGNFFLIFKTRTIFFTLPFVGKELSLWIPGAGWGVAGAAISTSISRWVAGILVLYVLYSGKGKVQMSIKEKVRLDFAIIKRIFHIGIPAALEQFLLRLGQLAFNRLIANLGTTMYAAHRITNTAESISYNVGFGFALAATTLVGQYLGAEDPEAAQESGHMAVKMGAIFMSIMGVFFFIWPQVFLLIFTRDPEILHPASWCLRIEALAQPFLAFAMGYAGALRGAGDTKQVLIISIVGIWGVRVSLTFLFISVLGYGLISAWVAMTIDLIVRGFWLLLAFRKGKWKTVEV
ncbi:MAG: MATE family efflux transporter [Epulopiscium sp.]|nr:MATE family efflux transporter [Candidatus Epulonipiscium sp.]